MLWFKHFTNNSTQNAGFWGLRAELGVEGYGRLMLLLENLIGGMDSLEAPPTTKATIIQWAHILGTKPKKVRMFLECCQNQGITSVEISETHAEVTLLNHKKLLTKSALSSDKRTTTGRVDEKRQDKSKTFSKDQAKENSAANPDGKRRSAGCDANEPVPPLTFTPNNDILNRMKGG